MVNNAQSGFSGVLIMDKPADFTSHDVVAKLRGILKTRRIGHGGTLDPMATGVLPVFIGSATRAADYAAAQDKEYEAGFTLGFSTDTQDTTGKTLQTSGKTATTEEVTSALCSFLGPQEQIPPMFSAIKIGGKKLCDLARRGVEVERPARPITIHEIRLLSFDETAQKGVFRVVSSKGTYVRTIVHDLGLRLGTLGAMHSLVRTRSGTLSLLESHSFAEVEQAMANGTLPSLLRPTDSLFTGYPRADLDDYGLQRAQSGAYIDPAHAPGMPMVRGALCRVYHKDVFLMLGRTDALQKGGLALFVHKNFR